MATKIKIVTTGDNLENPDGFNTLATIKHPTEYITNKSTLPDEVNADDSK